MIRFSLKAHNGQYLTVDDDANGSILANRNGVGPWEIFTHSRLRNSREVLTSGTRIHLQTAHGKFVVAEGGGGREVVANRSTPRRWESFAIEKLDGSGEITFGDRVTLRADNGQYLVAEGGGGRGVRAGQDVAREWETFVFEAWYSTLVHLICDGGQFLVAGGGGGFDIRADRPHARNWETFALINRSGRTEGFHDGDSVSLQAWNDQFVSATGGGGGAVTATANRSSSWERFRIEKVAGSPGSEILQNDRVAFRAADGVHYMVAEGGGGQEVRANRRHRRGWETFVLEHAAHRPIPFDVAPSSQMTEHAPLGSTGARITGARSILTLLVEYSDMPDPIDDTVTLEDIRETMFGSGRSVKRWIERNSHGLHSLADAGVYGPLKLPFSFSTYNDRPPLNATRDRLGPWETFMIRDVDDEPDIRHGSSISLKAAANEKYVVAENGGGGFVHAGSDGEGPEETFRILRTAGEGLVHYGDTIHLQAVNEQYLMAQSGGYDNLRADADSPGAWGTFRIEMPPQSGPIPSGGDIALRATTSPSGLPHPYVCADLIAIWYDTFNAAEQAGVPLRGLDINGDGTITTDEVHPIALDFSNWGNTGSRRIRAATTVGGVRYYGSAIGVGLYLKDGPVQGRAQLDEVFSVLVHELGHGLYDLPDRYGNRRPLRGDVMANRSSAREWETFRIHLVGGDDGDEIPSGSSVNLSTHHGTYVLAEDGGGGLVNAFVDTPGLWERFTIDDAGTSAYIEHDRTISLRTAHANKYVVAESGGGREVRADRDSPGAWGSFFIHKREGSGRIHSGDEVTFRAPYTRDYLVAEPDGRDTDPAALARGFQWSGGVGDGTGGGFDIMDHNHLDIMMSAYDRIRNGWLEPKVLTPGDRCCCLLRPAFHFAEALLLWDPLEPREGYLVENRQAVAGFDEVPSSGIVISWVNEDVDYWRRYFDESAIRSRARCYPAVVSAAASDIAPNQMIAPPTFHPREVFRRMDPRAAFSSNVVILPKGDGTASRFLLSFQPASGGEIAVCIE